MLGSANVDIALRVPELPKAGETVLGATRLSGPGGKGLNQAVAAARAGARTRFVGAVGTDPEGAELLRVLAADGIEALVRTTNGRTGLAVVIVDAAGENAIVVDPGANAELVGLGESERAAVTAAQVLLMQLEIPLPTVTEAARTGSRGGHDGRPQRRSPGATGRSPVRQHRPAARQRGRGSGARGRHIVGWGRRDGRGGAADTVDRDLDRLLDRVPAVLVTLGPRGALYRDRAGARHHEPGRSVNVVDTTAAGDSFAGYLAAALAEGLPVPVAMARANAAAALSVGRRGAVPAVPHRRDVDALAAG